MKKSLFLLGLLTLLLASCRGVDTADLLGSVPKDTKYFIILNTKKLGPQLDSRDLEELLGRGFNEKWSFLTSDGSGVDFTAPVVAFEYNRALITSLCLKDEKAFIGGIEEATASRFSEEAGVRVCASNTVFVKDGRAWITAEYPEVTAADIAMLLQLKEAESVLAIEAAAKLADSKKGMVSFINLDKTFTGFGSSNPRLYLNMIFDDLSYITAATDFDGNEAQCEVRFLNYKSEPSPLAFKAPALKSSAIEAFPGRGNLFAALGVTPDIMHSLLSRLKTFFPVPAEVQECLEQLDGEMIISMDATDKFTDPTGYSLMLTFKSSSAADKGAQLMRSLASTFGLQAKVYTDGKRLYALMDTSAEGSVKDFAGYFQGASLGVVALPSFFEGMASADDYRDFQLCSFMLKDSKKPVLTVTCKVKEGDKALPVMLKTFSDLWK